ncbi:MAG: peptide chain release factor N(5)-glutamine methyltransferase [Flavobacteriia bacterium]
MFNRALEERLKLSKEELLFANDIRLSESDLLYVRTIAHRLLDNEPFQYILGNTEFYGLELNCDQRALIPRPETEELVDWINHTFINKSHDFQIVDFCTGSGCIALALKRIFLNAQVKATDVSIEALTLSAENASKNQLEIQLLQHDLLQENTDFIEDNSQDCIVSNPPYIPEKDKTEMSDNVLNFEPHIALFVSNENPLIFYQRIAEIAQQKLKSGGFLFFEIHENLAEETKQLLLKLNFHNIEIKQDLQGKNRMLKTVK